MPVLLFYELGVSALWLAKLRRWAKHLPPRRRLPRAKTSRCNISTTQWSVVERGVRGSNSSTGGGVNVVLGNRGSHHKRDRETRLQNVLGVALVASDKQHEAAIYFQQLNSAWDNNVRCHVAEC